jgi:Ricin-type beta-trefoil lectin domain-like
LATHARLAKVMTGEASRRRPCGNGSQKPTRLKTFLEAVICAQLLLGCGTTPIDAVEADSDFTPSLPPFPQTDSCLVPSRGRFTLSLEGGCLRRGDPTSVFGESAFATELTMDCSDARAEWNLTPAAAGTFTLVNVDTRLALDVRAGSSFPGTPVLLYDPNGLDNQLFWPRLRPGGAYALQPRHAPELCVDARGDEIEAWPCDTTNENQALHFARVSCP